MLLRSNLFVFLASLFALLLLLPVGSVDGQEDEESDDNSSDGEEELPKSCNIYVYNLLISLLKITLECTATQVKFRNLFEYSTRFYCILKCVVVKLFTKQEFKNVMTEKVELDASSIILFLTDNLAPEVTEAIIPGTISCLDLAVLDLNDYWCNEWSPFITCTVKAITQGLVPYAANCVVNPIISVLFSFFTSIAPTPIRNDLNEMKRVLSMSKQGGPKCYNPNCTMKYKVEKKKGISSIIVYDKNMTEISRRVNGRKNSTIELTVGRSQDTPTTSRYYLNKLNPDE